MSSKRNFNYYYSDSYFTSGYARHRQATQSGENSTRVKGRLKIRDNNYNASMLDINSIRYVSGYNGKNKSCYIPGLSSAAPTQAIIDEMDRLALNKFYSKVVGFSANIADLVRTRKETVDMVEHTITRLTTAYMRLRHRDFRGFASGLGISLKRSNKSLVLSNPADIWLEHSYGWVPLISDVYAVLNKVPTPPSMRVVGSCKREKPFTAADTDYGYYVICTPAGSRYTVVSYSGLVTWDGAYDKSISEFGLDNPLAFAWEALPWSFVVDWFIPVGNYLENFVALHNGSLSIRGTRTLFTRVDCSFFAHPRTVDSCRILKENCTAHQMSIKRTVGIPPQPIPRLKDPLSLDHIANALSLMSQAFSKKGFIN